MAKKVYGKCCICGENKKLTFEHIPPRAAFNSFGIKLYDFLDTCLKTTENIQIYKMEPGNIHFALTATT